MSTTALNVSLRVEGVLTDPDSNAATVTNVVRTDTSAVVLAGPVSMTRVSAGVYTYPLTDPTTGLTYTWSANFIRNGVTLSIQLSTTGTLSPDDPAGYYWTLATLQTLDGPINVAIESNLDNTTLAADYARIQAVGDDGDAWHDQAWTNANSGRTMPIGLTAGDYRQSSRIVTKWIVGRLMLARQNSSSATKQPLNTFQAEAENELSAMIFAYMQRGEFPQGPSDFDNSRPIQYYPPTPTRGWPYGVW